MPFRTHLYDYVDHGGARHAAAALGVDESAVVKTLVMVSEAGDRLLVLMHGDRQVSSKKLARAAGLRSVAACSPAEALRLTGYQVGGISPFGTRKTLPIYAEATIFELPTLFINGGRRGLLLEIEPGALESSLDLVRVSVAAD